MAIASYLIDTSVLCRMTKPAVARPVGPLVARGLLAVCPVIEMELIVGAKNPADCHDIREWFLGFELLTSPDRIWERAVKTQCALVEKSEHRTVRVPDLIIAATAEHHGVTVLHYDRDFDRIAEVTGQPTEWVVPLGEAD